MASTTSLFFNTSNQQPPRAQPDPNPNTTPKPRSRRGGRAQKGPSKTPQRGMGVEKLELEIQRQKGTSPTHRILASRMLANNNNNNHLGPLAGVPVHPYPVTLAQYYFPGQLGGPTSFRAVPMGGPEVALELPSMPNHNTVSYKKKRVNGEEENEEIGFGNGKEKHHFFVDNSDQSLQIMSNDVSNYNHGVNFGGFDGNNKNNIGENYHHFAVNNGVAFPGYYGFTAVTGSEAMGIQQKWSRSNVMEYGFFPGKPDDTVNEEENSKDNDYNNTTNNNNINNNHYYNPNDYLDLKLGCSNSSYNSSPSSSLTTVTNTTTTVGVTDTSLDLSLKL